MKLTLKLVVVLLLFWYNSALPQPAQRAQELLDLSATQNLTNRPLAIQSAQEALTLFTSANDAAGMANAYAALGQYHYAQNDLLESTQHYNSALEIWRRLNNPAEQADVLRMLSYIEGRKGEWLSAIDYLTQAQNLVNAEANPKTMGGIEAGLAYVFNESGMPESGLTHYQQALHHYRHTPDAYDDNRMTLQIGYTYFLLQRYSEAITNIEQALASFEPSTVHAAECHEYLGKIYITTGDHKLALEHLEIALPIYQRTRNPREAAQVIALIGQAYEQQGAVAQARRNYLEASTSFRRLADRVNDAAVRFALGRLELKAGNYEAAESYLKESIENTENIRRDLDSRVFAAAFSASAHERYAAYINCLIRKHKAQPTKGFDVLAFQASELARGRSLAELLRDTQTNVLAGVDPRLAQQEKNLRQSIRVKLDQRIDLLAHAYRKQELDELDAVLKRLREQHNQVSEQLRRLNPSVDHIVRPTAYSLSEIQEKVIGDDQTMLLEYLLGENASYVWAVTRTSIKLFELPKEAEITEAVRKVYELLASEPTKESDSKLTVATNELAKMVVAPVADQLTTRQLIVVADGALNYIPFQLLPASPGKSEPLVATHEVINAPSASILGQLRQENLARQRHVKVLAAFGDPAFISNYPQLAGKSSGESIVLAKADGLESSRPRGIDVSGDSVDPARIQSLLYTQLELGYLREVAGAGAFIASGFDASRNILERTDLSQYSILHLATHGILNPKSPELSGFFLSMVDAERREQNGFMTLRDVYRLRAPVDLVVLSACRTALGKEVRGEGLIGLTRGFMHAGASSVAASLWKVDDEATAELMKHFYANMLQKGMTPAAALRAAQNTIREDPQWQSPHFWAAFTLQGEYKQTIKAPTMVAPQPTSKPFFVAGMSLAVLVGVGAWYWRHRRMGYSTRNK